MNNDLISSHIKTSIVEYLNRKEIKEIHREE